jgi:DNA-binding NtrC family response regulator
MKNGLLVLLVHDDCDSFVGLESLLLNLEVETCRARNCSETVAALREPRMPKLIFTSVALNDGTWADVLDIAAMHGKRIPVIVVSPAVDIQLYLQTLERGAFDFIVPPISQADLEYIVRNASWENSAKAVTAGR